MGDGQVDELVRTKLAALAEDDLLALVMVAGLDRVDPVAHRGASQRARGLLDVLLGVVALAETEELPALFLVFNFFGYLFFFAYLLQISNKII